LEILRKGGIPVDETENEIEKGRNELKF